MVISHDDIEHALNNIELFMNGKPDYWDFIRHKDRYANDAKILGDTIDNSVKASSPVVEIGSFPGHFTALLSELQIPFIGIDLSPERMDGIKAHFHLDIRQCDIERESLPLSNGSVNYLVFSEVFEHLRVDPLFTLTELNRVLKLGGYMLLTTPNLYSIQQCARFISGRGFGDPLNEFNKLRTLGHMGHIREYSHREICRFLEFSGFEVEQMWYKHFYYGSGKRGLLKRLVFSVVPPRFRTFQVVLVRKTKEASPLSPLY